MELGLLKGDEISCRGIQLFGAYQAERFGGQYMYFCPLSLLHWCSPIMRDGMMEGALVAGPVLITPVEDLMVENILERLNLGRDRRELLLELYDSVPMISPGRSRSLAQILYSLAIVNSDLEDYDQEAFQQQTKIGEYLHLLKSMGGDKSSEFEYPIEEERKLLRFISRGKKKESQEILNRILAKVLTKSGVNLDVMKSRVLELTVLLSRAALEGGADLEQIFGLNYYYLTKIRDLDSYEDLSSWLGRIMNRFTDLVFLLPDVKHTDTILRAVRFMREHFYERLSLNDVAGHVALSPPYFSKMFRAEMKISFTQYLNRLRVEEAKRLLKTSQSSLGDIAYSTGFEDQSYFTKVFKRISGLSPSRYRENSRAYPGDNQEIHH